METPVTDMDSPSKKLAFDYYHRHHGGELHRSSLWTGTSASNRGLYSPGSLPQVFAPLRFLGEVRKNSHSFAAGKVCLPGPRQLVPDFACAHETRRPRR